MEEIKKISLRLRGISRSLKKEIAVEALNHYKDKFSHDQKWNGRKWEEPLRRRIGPLRLKRRRGYRKGFGPRDRTRNILVKTGTLSRSLRYRLEKDKIVFFTNVPYARRHNEGLKGMPKRTFLGMEPSLKARIEKIISRNLDNLF